MDSLRLLIISVSFLDFANSNPWGAPCNAGTLPGHGFKSQSAPPYVLEIRESCYVPSKEIKIQLKTDQPFHGFVFQSRVALPALRAGIGAFMENSPQRHQWKYNCGSAKYSITHTSKEDKNGLTLLWMPPHSEIGEIEIVATVFNSPSGTQFGEYWHEGGRILLGPCSSNTTTEVPRKHTNSATALERLKSSGLELPKEQAFVWNPRCNTPPPTVPWCRGGLLVWEIRWYHIGGTCTTAKWFDASCIPDWGFSTYNLCRKTCESNHSIS